MYVCLFVDARLSVCLFFLATAIQVMKTNGTVNFEADGMSLSFSLSLSLSSVYICIISIHIYMNFEADGTCACVCLSLSQCIYMYNKYIYNKDTYLK